MRFLNVALHMGQRVWDSLAAVFAASMGLLVTFLRPTPAMSILSLADYSSIYPGTISIVVTGNDTVKVRTMGIRRHELSVESVPCRIRTCNCLEVKSSISKDFQSF
ncbi:hypothetical protein ACFLVS_00010 [Chloroflexota bacterium]